MTKFNSLALVVFAFVGVSSPVCAENPVEQSFSRDGQTYHYTVTRKGDLFVVNGRTEPSHKRFSLQVRNNYVAGSYDTAAVNFVVQKSVAPVETAAR